jgi:hypothetical protein
MLFLGGGYAQKIFRPATLPVSRGVNWPYLFLTLLLTG